MANHKLIELQSYKEDLRKFEYFVLGVTIAILAFSAQYTSPNSNCKSLVIISWGCFLFSFLSGLFRRYLSVRSAALDYFDVIKDVFIPEKKDTLYIASFWIQFCLLIVGLLFYAIFQIVNILTVPVNVPAIPPKP